MKYVPLREVQHEDGLSVSPTRLQQFKRVAECRSYFEVQFARHGIPEVLVTDNGTQFSSSEFVTFAKTWGFEHNTSSLQYLQANGKVENSIKVCKALLRKARAHKEDPILALLDWRNTTSKCIGTSLVQHLMGRRTWTLLPTHTKLLEPKVYHQTRDKLAKQKAIQKEPYNTKNRLLMPLQPDQAIRMKLPGDMKWSLGSCVKTLPNHSYEVDVSGHRCCQNRCQLRTTAEIPPSPSLEDNSSHHPPQATKPPSASQNTELIIDHNKPAAVTSQPAVQ